MRHHHLIASLASMAITHISTVLLLSLAAAASFSFTHGSGRFDQDVDITWGDGRGKFLDDGQLLTLSMDNYSGSGFQSKNQYLFSKLDMDMKLIAGDSAGTVTTFYLSSQGPNHDEVDFEFLGNLSGDPYILNTNLFAQGKGRREQQFYLWFDPTAEFHTYTILWNKENIIWYIDGTPIRVFKNYEKEGVQFPSSQPMSMYASLWDGGDWATRGGKIKIDWSQAPFTASYKSFYAEACVWSPDAGSTCDSTTPGSWFHQELDSEGESKLEWAQHNYMIYNYCTDVKRFPQGLPPECSISLHALRSYI